MKEHKGVDLFEPRAIMEAEPRADVVAEPMHAFAFAFNDPNFSDRVLRIEIVGGVPDSSGEEVGCLSITEWARNRKRRREEMKREIDIELIVDFSVRGTKLAAGSAASLICVIELSIYCEDSASVNQPDIEDGVAFENEEEEVVAMIEESPSEGGEALTRSLSWSTDCSTVLRVKEIHISSAILAAKSPFFYKLFSNGMKESEQRDITLRINASEEDAVMGLINYMYNEKITTSSPPALLDILMAADKFEVASCMRYCSTLLRNLPMTTESALLYLELPSTVSMADAVQPLTDAAKHFLAKRYKDLSKSQEEILNLPLAGIEAILSSDDLQVGSEDAVFDFVLKWARLQYPKNDERRQVLGSRLSRLIRFPNMTSRKLKKVLACSDLNPDLASKIVLDALFFKVETPHRQRMLASEDPPNKRFIERAYRYRPVKVVEFDVPHQQCVVYLDLKREECGLLFPTGRVYSQAFHLGGHGFFLSAHCNMDQQSSFHCFGLFLGMQEKGSVSVAVDYEFATRSKPTCDFGIKYRGNYIFTGGKAVGYRNLFGIPWRSFTADDSPYFINGTLHLRVELTVRQLQ